MEKLITLTAVAAPIDIDNMDTDQLMPKQFLRGIDKSGLAKGLLYNHRHLSDGTLNPNFVLNKPGFENTRIIVAGPNFGCGSSREHAVWGLMQYGIRAVVAAGFGEIFYSNCFNNGLLAAKISPQTSAELFNYLSDSEPQRLTVSVKDKEIRTLDGSNVWAFELAERHQTMLLEGLDMLESTMKELELIRKFKLAHEKAFPWMSNLAGRYAKNE